MTNLSAESILEIKRRELNELKKNLDAFGKLTKEMTDAAKDAASILEQLKSDSGMKESELFESFQVSSATQRFIKNIGKEQDTSKVTAAQAGDDQQ
jgi:hypothetical protein